jgi:hypothetical protein
MLYLFFITAHLPAFSLETYGAKVDQLKAEIGTAVMEAEVENALLSKKYKVLTFTHVDTSYACLSLLIDSPKPVLLSQNRCSIQCQENRRDREEGFPRYPCEIELPISLCHLILIRNRWF